MSRHIIRCTRCALPLDYDFYPVDGSGAWVDGAGRTACLLPDDDTVHTHKRPSGERIPLTVRWEMWQWARRHNVGGVVTKWDLIDDGERADLRVTPCNLSCGYCDEPFTTEADFARHFTLADPTYLNLGECPRDALNSMQRRRLG